jgi:hypothetical protein
VSSDLSAKPSPLFLPSSTEAEVDHEVEGGIQHCEQVVDADQNKDPLQKNKKINIYRLRTCCFYLLNFSVFIQYFCNLLILYYFIIKNCLKKEDTFEN